MAAEATAGEIEELSGRMQGCPRDFLRRFGGNSCHDEPPVVAESKEVEEIGLSLGLSLGGCFGVEPEEKRLVRSSSVATLMFPVEQDFPVADPLARACSLPTEAEEEQRKRKALQSLKRLEAKRKRSEKRNLSKLAARDQREENFNELMKGVSTHRLPGWASTGTGARRADASRCLRPASQGSIGSQRGSFSGVSNFESQTVQGPTGCAEVRSPSMTMMVGKPASSAGEEEESSKKVAAGRPDGVKREMERSMMEEMPCVSTTGDGPNGRRIEGFLYRYKKGEEVRIVCVCHGSFLTPAEFVRHAGGGDVAHPLRHIVVNPTQSASLW